MATPRTAVAAAKAAPTLSEATKKASTTWVQQMPTRAIADALLTKEKCMTPYDGLYEEVNQTGLFRSHRHFKHCLKLLKVQKRVKVIHLGPERVTNNVLKFSVKLTSRGQKTYSFYKRSFEKAAMGDSKGDERGLKDALP